MPGQSRASSIMSHTTVLVHVDAAEEADTAVRVAGGRSIGSSGDSQP